MKTFDPSDHERNLLRQISEMEQESAGQARLIELHRANNAELERQLDLRAQQVELLGQGHALDLKDKDAEIARLRNEVYWEKAMKLPQTPFGKIDAPDSEKSSCAPSPEGES